MDGWWGRNEAVIGAVFQETNYKINYFVSFCFAF